MHKILVTGALGQIGTELVAALREEYGAANVVSSDIRIPQRDSQRDSPHLAGPFEHLDCTHRGAIRGVVARHSIETIYHLAALLSAVAEEKPQAAWELNVGGVYSVLEVARERGCAVFVPSSIGAFGPGTPRVDTPQVTVQRPITMYGVTKVTGELLCDYYFHRFGVDTRGARFPGIISWTAPPGGGTTDYAVEIFYQALRYGRYTCFLKADTSLDMMYMPDAVRATIELMQADQQRLEHRNAFNVTAMQFTPEELAAAIREHLPKFAIDYQVDPVRQAIADTWPQSLDDSAAREEWGWKPEYDLASMTADMLENLERKLSVGRDAAKQD